MPVYTTASFLKLSLNCVIIPTNNMPGKEKYGSNTKFGMCSSSSNRPVTV